MNKYWIILHFLVTFFMRFEGKLKKAYEANKTTIASFSFLVRALIVLLVTNTCKLALKQQLVYKQPTVRMLIVKQLLGPNYLVISKNLKI